MAQKNAPGYYVDYNNDSIPGTFDNYKEWILTPATVPFTRQKDGARIFLQPLNCRYFQTDGGDRYESFHVKRLLNAIADNTDGDTAAYYEDKIIFLRVVYVHPRFRLLEYNDRRRNNLFIADENRKPEELIYKATKTVNIYTEDVSYRRQLVKYLGNIPGHKTNEVQEDLAALPYNSEAMEALLVKVFGAAAESTSRKKAAAKLHVSGGASLNRMNYDAEGSVGANAEDLLRSYSGYTSPLIGLGITIYQQRNFSRNFIDLSAQLYSFKHRSQYSVPFNSKTKDATIEGTVAEFLVMGGRHFVQAGRISWYAAPGMSLSFLLNSKEQVDTRFTPTDNPTTEVNENTRAFAAISLQTGLQFNRSIGLWVRYKHKADVDKFIARKNLHSAVQFGVEYYFGK